MGEQMLSRRRPAGRMHAGIALTTPTDTLDTRAQVADLVRMKDPADRRTTVRRRASCAPRVRLLPPSAMMGLRSAIGETEFEQQQILGYAPVEPDGSFKLQIPADMPIALSIVDAKGRAFQTHTNWIQVRPGERRTCDGCHSPRRGGALNSGTVVNTMPAALVPSLAGAHQSGETMASTRTRLDASALSLQADPVFTDVWADTTQAGVTARPSITMRYTGNANPADNLATPAPTQRPHQLPGAHPAVVDARSWREHLHRMPCRHREARPARHDLAARAVSRRTKSC